MAKTLAEVKASLTGGKRRPNLGEAVPTSDTRRVVQRGFLAALRSFSQRVRGQAGLRRTAAARQAQGKLAKEIARLKAALTPQAGLKGIVSRLTRGLAGIAASAIEKVVGETRLFTRPVSALRKRPSATMLSRTPGGNDMIGVSSSNVFSVGYDPEEQNPATGLLIVQFRSESRIYEYQDAPSWLFKGILNSRSPGRYVWDFIRPLYDGTSMYRRVA